MTTIRLIEHVRIYFACINISMAERIEIGFSRINYVGAYEVCSALRVEMRMGPGEVCLSVSRTERSMCCSWNVNCAQASIRTIYVEGSILTSRDQFKDKLEIEIEKVSRSGERRKSCKKRKPQNFDMYSRARHMRLQKKNNIKHNLEDHMGCMNRRRWSPCSCGLVNGISFLFFFFFFFG